MPRMYVTIQPPVLVHDSVPEILPRIHEKHTRHKLKCWYHYMGYKSEAVVPRGRQRVFEDVDDDCLQDLLRHDCDDDSPFADYVLRFLFLLCV